jgi:hypothetical protein
MALGIEWSTFQFPVNEIHYVNVTIILIEYCIRFSVRKRTLFQHEDNKGQIAR